MKAIWVVLTWVFAVCGLAAYLSAWGNVWFGWNLWRATPDTLFSDAIATGVFALFFLAWGTVSIIKDQASERVAARSH